MGTAMESFVYVLAAISLIAAFLVLSNGVKRLCYKYLKRRDQHDDQ